MNDSEDKACGKISWLRRYVCRGMQYVVITAFIIASVYGIWGWITLNDIRQYCTDNNIDFNKVIIDCFPELPGFSYSGSEKEGYQFSTLPQKPKEREYPELARYFVPFVSIQINEIKGSNL